MAAANENAASTLAYLHAYIQSEQQSLSHKDVLNTYTRACALRREILGRRLLIEYAVQLDTEQYWTGLWFWQKHRGPSQRGHQDCYWQCSCLTNCFRRPRHELTQNQVIGMHDCFHQSSSFKIRLHISVSWWHCWQAVVYRFNCNVIHISEDLTLVALGSPSRNRCSCCSCVELCWSTKHKSRQELFQRQKIKNNKK